MQRIGRVSNSSRVRILRISSRNVLSLEVLAKSSSGLENFLIAWSHSMSLDGRPREASVSRTTSFTIASPRELTRWLNTGNYEDDIKAVCEDTLTHHRLPGLGLIICSRRQLDSFISFISWGYPSVETPAYCSINPFNGFAIRIRLHSIASLMLPCSRSLQRP